MKVKCELRLENDQVDNTWFSDTQNLDLQVHMPRELYIGMGSPQLIRVTLEPK